MWKAPEHFFDRDAPSSVYLGERRHYEKLHSLEEFDPLKNFRFFGQLALRAVLLWIVFVVGQIGITIFTLILSVISPEVGLIIGSLIEFAWFIAIACVFWLVKVPSQVSEWKFTVDDKGAVAATALDHIAWSLGQRNPPLDIMKVRRFALPGGEHRDLLELRQGIYYGLVSTLANGKDLYVGWTYWVYMSPVRLLWTFILRIVAQVRGHGNALYASVQFDRSKALRESLHGAVLEGVEVAAGRQAPHGQGTIGGDVAIVEVDSAESASWLVPEPSM